MKIISPQTIAFEASITEDELKHRMAMEVLASINALDAEGNPAPGITWKVLRGRTKKGGYTISVTGPMPARMSLPAATGDEQ